MGWFLCLSILLVLSPSIWARSANPTRWHPRNLPNPQTGGHKGCGMTSSANICDPDEVLSEEARYRLNHNLQQLESRTRQDGSTFCDRKGITGGLVVVRRTQAGKSREELDEMANELLKRWDLDPQCKKAVMLVLSTEDQMFVVARMDDVPLSAEDFNKLFAKQKQEFREHDHAAALSNILQGTWDLALQKQWKPKSKGRNDHSEPKRRTTTDPYTSEEEPYRSSRSRNDNAGSSTRMSILLGFACVFYFMFGENRMLAGGRA